MSSTSTSNPSVPGLIGGTPTVSTAPEVSTATSTAVVTAPSPAVSTAISIGLSLTQVCTDGAKVADVMSNLISQRFTVDPTNVAELKAEMKTYFAKAGVINEQIFSFMTEFKSWPDVNKVGRGNSALKHISVPVVLLLTKLAGYTNKMLIAGYFLSNTVIYNDFSSWVSSLPTPSSHLDNVGSFSNPSSNDEHKIPPFKVPIFKGDSLAGDKYI